MKPLGYLAIDQYGNIYQLETQHPRKELLEMFNRSSCKKMYADFKDNTTKHVGYIIAGFWLNIYQVCAWK